jgi:hypothetical protein
MENSLIKFSMEVYLFMDFIFSYSLTLVYFPEIKSRLFLTTAVYQ